jgi:hypothetical protein
MHWSFRGDVARLSRRHHMGGRNRGNLGLAQVDGALDAAIPVFRARVLPGGLGRRLNAHKVLSFLSKYPEIPLIPQEVP